MRIKDKDLSPTLEGFRAGFTSFLTFYWPSNLEREQELERELKQEIDSIYDNEFVEEAWNEVGEALTRTIYGNFYEAEPEDPEGR